MDARHLNTIDFPLVLARLAEHATFSAGKELVLALRPSPIGAEVKVRLQQTREGRELLDAGETVALGGVHDVRPLAHQALRGAHLQPANLLDIGDTLRAARRVHRMLTRLQARTPLLADIASRIELCQPLADEIGRCISDQAEVVDHASARLARIRKEMRTAHDRLLEKLNRFLSSPQFATYLQEPLVMQRAGRYVIPVKADFRGRVRGIVHDSSASGATVFIEPLAVVDLGNRWRDLQLEEAREIERILAELSDLVAGMADELSWTVEALAEVDMILAKGRYANLQIATEPALVPFENRRGSHHPGSTLDLRQARHPLLDPEAVVPIDVEMAGDSFVLVISGPNTGGKTVSLKTVGLMVAMAQCGLHLPAGEGSALSVFEAIYADIGDEQSIEQSLSTFSSHLTNIVSILDQANSRCLLLLDELGAGTDPVEGSALARSILTHILERRITTLVATHYSELKAYAHTTSGVENASVEFDVVTLAPTFRLQVGLPGRSNAFAIAQRLGLPSRIVHVARSLISPEELQTESLLAEIQQAHQEATVARDEATMGRRDAKEEQRRLAARLASIEAERASILGEARAQARQEISAVRAQLDQLRSEIPGKKTQSAVVEEWLEQARLRLQEQEKTVQPPLASPPVQAMRLPGEIVVGDTVWVQGLGTTGLVTALAEDGAEVQVGSFRVRVAQSTLERRALEARDEPEPATSDVSFHPSPGAEVDLRGQRVEETLPRVDKYLDDAFLAGLPFVRIIHGKGTGALRAAIRQQLRDHPLVKSFRSGEQGEGGSGVTVAYLLGE